MRTIIILIMLSISSMAMAKEYLVKYFNRHTRVVMTEESCLVDGFHGNRASVQRADGWYLQGCWYYADEAHKYIRIDWANPEKAGDYTEHRFSDFKSVDVPE